MLNKFTYVAILFSGLTVISCNNSSKTKDAEQKAGKSYDFTETLSKYNTEIPTEILTPSKVETRIGRLEFYDGLPTEETANKVLENLSFMRGVEVFLNFVPMASLEGIRRGMEAQGVKESNQVMIFDELMDSNPLFLTGNTGTVYCSAMLNLEKDGPTVVEIPEGCGPSTVNDAFFRFVTDMGLPGPDRGKGGKYLILPPNYKGDVPEGYYVSKSTSYVNWLIMRGLLVDGKPDAPRDLFRNNLKIYPLSKKDNQPAMEFSDASGKSFNTIHANTFPFYEEINAVIQREPVEMLDPELRGLASSIGIQKGKEFKPDEKMRQILEDAVAVGNATARSLVFKGNMEGMYTYTDSKTWKTAFVGGDYKWLVDEGKGGRNLDARTMFFYFATVNTPAMAWKLIGKGSKYAYATADSKGNYLYGEKTYKLNIPADVPALNFWSLVAYDPQTRSELQTSQPYPSVNSARSEFKKNADGSVDIYFGPKAPQGFESNWIETVPGKGWFTILRLYSPTEAWYDQTWRPGEIELVE